MGSGESLDPLVRGVENPEYSGYGSAGIVIENGAGIGINEFAGTVSKRDAEG